LGEGVETKNEIIRYTSDIEAGHILDSLNPEKHGFMGWNSMSLSMGFQLELSSELRSHVVEIWYSSTSPEHYCYAHINATYKAPPATG
jgi:hypothetical protein